MHLHPLPLILLSLLPSPALTTPSPPPSYPSPDPIVNLTYSTYSGLTLRPSNVDQFLGIRFAAPPLGPLRWRAPQDPLRTPPSQILPAKKYAPICLGSTGPILSNATNEDCLFLDVWTPTAAKRKGKGLLPVWFFIQGGGYAGDLDANYNGSEVVRNSGEGIVFVEFNYRVGVYGFLAGEKVRGDGDLNVGLLDQRKALEWVRKYIHLFGGDPNHIVIHGDSAGGGSVAHFLTAYGGRNDGLFVGAIAESPFWPTQRTVAESEFQFQQFANQSGCGSSKNTMACLRSKNTTTLQAADVVPMYPGAPGPALWSFLPCIDGVLNTDYLYNLFDQGKVIRVPLMVGDDTDEGTFFAPNAATSVELLDFIKNNYPKLSKAQLQQINSTYPKNGFGSFVLHAPYFPATQAAYGESTFTCPGIQMANSLARYNSPAKTWNYRYNVQDQAYTSIGLGVPHVSEEPAIFGPGNTAGCIYNNCSYTTYNAPMVPIVMGYWLSFIRSLNPNTYKSSTAPIWQNWYSQKGVQQLQRLKFQLNDTKMENVPSDQLKRCAVWKSLGVTMEQ